MAFPEVIVTLIGEYCAQRDLLWWIPLDKLDWNKLSSHTEMPLLLDVLRCAMPEVIDKIAWYHLSQNPKAMDLLNAEPHNIQWDGLSENPAAMDLYLLRKAGGHRQDLFLRKSSSL